MPQFVESGAARLAVERLSTGAVPAVALHAGVADRRSWRSLADALAPDVGLIAYDRRGFGGTEDVTEPHRHLDDLEAVLDAVLPGERPLLLGNSRGGRIALDLALRRPDRISGLVLIASAVSGEDEEDEPELPPAVAALDDAIEAADDAGDLDEVNRLEAHLWLDGPLEPEGRVQGAARELFLAMNGRALHAEDPGEAIEPDGVPALHRLPELAVPTLVLLGALDVFLVIDRGRTIAAQVPGAELVELEGVAHLPQLERPHAVAEAIRAWLARRG